MNEAPQNFGDVKPGNQEDISTERLDDALIAVRQLEAEHDEKEKARKNVSIKLIAAKDEFMSLMKAAGKKRWECEGVLGFTMFDETKFTTPKGPHDKAAFFGFIQSEEVSKLLKADPDDIFLKYASVNYQALNTFCKSIKELAAESGDDVQIPGLAAPTTETKLRSLPRKRGK